MIKNRKKLGLVVLGILVLAVMVMFFFAEPVTQEMPEGLSEAEKRDWVAEQVYESIYTHDLVDLDYKEPSKQELEKKKQQTDLTRHYPERINALFEVGANTATLLYLTDELKDLGVNTYFVQAEYELKRGKAKIFMPGYSNPMVLSQEKAKRVIIDRMLMVKEKGFAVGFLPDYPTFFNFGKEKYDVDKLEVEYIRIALEWAKIAEEYGLEYFVPVNEYEKLLESNGFDLDFIYQRTNAFYDKLMPQLRQIYSGKIIIKTGHLGDWANHKNLDFKSGDLFGVGEYFAREASEIQRSIKEMVQEIDQISQRDGVPWLITEYLIATPEDLERDFANQGVKLDMKDAYEAGLKEYRKARNAVGFTFTGWIGTGKIRGTGAVPILKEYFAYY